MAANNILGFGTAGSNELSQAAYAADAQRTSGNQPGVARSQLVNKVLHQLSTIAAGVGQYIADRQATDVVDTLTPSQVAAMLTNASGPKLAVITISGSFTVPAGVYLLDVEIWGGGGSSGGVGSTSNGTSSGGGSGGYARGILAVTPGQVIACTIGAGGLGVTNTAGGNSSFGALLTAGGGGAGSVNGVGTGGAAGAAGTGGIVNLSGQSGSAGLLVGATGAGGPGASAPFGGAGGGGAPGSGSTGGIPGGGGGGRGSSSIGSGADGARGQINIRY